MYRLPAQRRLSTQHSINNVLRNATSRRSFKFVRVLGAPNDRAVPRLGLAIPKHAAKRAVDRNHIKRIVREWFRHKQADLPALDIVVQLRVAPESAMALRESLHKVSQWLTSTNQPSDAYER